MQNLSTPCRWLFRILTAFLFLAGFSCLGQTDSSWIRPFTSGIEDFTLKNPEEKASITSQNPLLLRESPGTIAVVSEEEIAQSGARDLMDVLRLIPGIEFHVDVQGVVGIGIRGQNANEASVVLVDGLEMNELLFGSNQFGNHFPIEQIRRIEIIRGPGSVMYGGLAVFAVINLITRGSEWHNGIRVAQTLGETASGMARRNTSASFGYIGPKVRVGVVGYTGEGIRSDRTYTDLEGNSYNMRQFSGLSSAFLGIHVKTGNLFIKSVLDRYRMQVRDFQTRISSQAYPVSFNSNQWELRYQWKKSDRFSVLPFVNVRMQLPWHTPNPIEPADTDKVYAYKIKVYRILPGLSFVWKAGRNLEVLGAVQGFREWSDDRYKIGGFDESARFQCLTGYSQATWKTNWGTLSGGARLDYHSYYKPTWSGRLNYNRAWEYVYLKAGINRSFRTPTLNNITYSLVDRLDPQITYSFEGEAGWDNKKGIQWSLNAYRISIEKGLIFQILDNGLDEGYTNSGRMGTLGLESNFRFTRKQVGFQLTYSFFTTQSLPVNQSQTAEGKNVNLAYPGHKITAQGKWHPSNRSTLTGTVLVLSARYGFNGNFSEPATIRYAPLYQLNLFYQYRDLFLKGLAVGFGVHDLTNSRYQFIQPYNSGHMPLPTLNREFVLKISYGIQTISTL